MGRRNAEIRAALPDKLRASFDALVRDADHAGEVRIHKPSLAHLQLGDGHDNYREENKKCLQTHLVLTSGQRGSSSHSPASRRQTTSSILRGANRHIRGTSVHSGGGVPTDNRNGTATGRVPSPRQVCGAKCTSDCARWRHSA